MILFILSYSENRISPRIIVLVGRATTVILENLGVPSCSLSSSTIDCSRGRKGHRGRRGPCCGLASRAERILGKAASSRAICRTWYPTLRGNPSRQDIPRGVAIHRVRVSHAAWQCNGIACPRVRAAKQRMPHGSRPGRLAHPLLFRVRNRPHRA